MMETILPNIPRVYTGLAEWAACLVFIFNLQPRCSRKKQMAIGILMLFVQTTFLQVTRDVPIYFWILCMAIAVLLMILFLYLCCNVSKLDAAYCGIIAFVMAEFTASFEWQIVCYLILKHIKRVPVIQLLLLIAIYSGIYVIMWWILKNYYSKNGKMDIRTKEFISAFIIGVAVFAISNLSYLSLDTPFSSQYAFEISNIRTIVDLGGIAILYAHMIQCGELRIRQELEVMQQVLQNQYLQYKQSKESIDLINYKYHDLKHQIHVLRSENNPEKRDAFLQKMEDEIRFYEVQNKTGNKVLDTVLTSKSLTCVKNDITFTCIADGTLLDFMDVADICAIFGNALDNAIESVRKTEDKEKRLIHVTVSRQKAFLMIRFENYFEGTLDYQGDVLQSTKKDKALHGYGIKSIEYAVNKYGGAVSINTNDNWFDMKILIPLGK